MEVDKVEVEVDLEEMKVEQGRQKKRRTNPPVPSTTCLIT